MIDETLPITRRRSRRPIRRRTVAFRLTLEEFRQLRREAQRSDLDWPDFLRARLLNPQDTIHQEAA